nr:hypothetical protein [uncultured Nitrososphaera sp.]
MAGGLFVLTVQLAFAQASEPTPSDPIGAINGLIGAVAALAATILSVIAFAAKAFRKADDRFHLLSDNDRKVLDAAIASIENTKVSDYWNANTEAVLAAMIKFGGAESPEFKDWLAKQEPAIRNYADKAASTKSELDDLYNQLKDKYGDQVLLKKPE